MCIIFLDYSMLNPLPSTIIQDFSENLPQTCVHGHCESVQMVQRQGKEAREAWRLPEVRRNLASVMARIPNKKCFKEKMR